MRVYKAGLPLDSEPGISSLLARKPWTTIYRPGVPTESQNTWFARKTPLFVCSTLEAAREVGALPEGLPVDIWEAEASEVFPPYPFAPHPDRGTEARYSFWHIRLDFRTGLRYPDDPLCPYRCPVHVQTLLAFQVTLVRWVERIAGVSLQEQPCQASFPVDHA